MKNAIAFAGLIALLFTLNSFTPQSTNTAMGNAWVKLGSRKVNFGLDRDVIRAGAKDGGFRKLKLQVTGGALSMHRMVVEYGNGTTDNIPLKHNFRRGQGTRVIDLQAGKRVIKNITFWYDSKNRSRRRATLTVFGRR